MGAESCRVSLLRWRHGEPEVTLAHRFSNGAVETPVGLKWDLQRLLTGVDTGLRHCAEMAPEGVASIGVDGWAVDYVRLDPQGAPLADPYCYRDERTQAAEQAVHQRISREQLYDMTGVQLLPLNTLYQLYSDGMQGVDSAAPWVNLPEFVLQHLGGRRVAEYTNATHTQLVALGRTQWNDELFRTLGLNVAAAPPIVAAGALLGELQGPLTAVPALRGARLIAPACHDTAAAIAAIPATGDDWAFISSGTWSLVGTVLDAPCASVAARAGNYTNLGAVGGRVLFLRNVNGMWLLRQCMEEWEQQGRRWTLSELIAAAEHVSRPREGLDVDDRELLLPGNMPARINAQRTARGAAPLSETAEDAPVMAASIFASLAARYGEIVADVQRITRKHLRRLFVVGGGSQNALLNRLTAEATGLEVIPGPVEASTIGNFAVQLAALRGSGANGVTAEDVAHWASLLGEMESVTAPLKSEGIA